MHKILVINLGGSSSKLAIFRNLDSLAEHTIRHSSKEMATAPLAEDQLAFRRKLILEWVNTQGENIDAFSAIAIRGATIPEAKKSGTYLIDGLYRKLLLELYTPGKAFFHGNRIITPLAIDLVADKKIPIYTTDPTSVDEFKPVAKISGLKEYRRRSRLHVLNPKMVARKHAQFLGKDVKDCNFVVAHLGAGLSVAAHEGGLIVDSNDAGEGYGPFSPERAGTVSTEAMLDMCYNRKLSYDEVFSKVRGYGGVMAHLGMKDLRKVEGLIAEGNEYAQLVYEALAYQIAKDIGSYAVVLKGKVDAILITGGIAYSKTMISKIEEYVKTIAPVVAYPGEFENEALAAGAHRVLSGKEKAIIL